MDSVVTDVEWGTGGELYFSPPFFKFVFVIFISESPLFSFFALLRV